MSVYRLNCLAIGLLLMCLPVSAQEPDLGITIGGQTWDIDGNYQLFRTRENREDGPLVEELWLNLVDKDNNYALFDHFRLDASGFGGNPHGRLAFSMTRNETYKLELNYRRFSHYSSLIDFANPLFDDGVTNSQHTLDQTSHNLNLNLTLRPGKKLQPILGWNWYDKGGPRRTTFSIGGDEFRLDSQVDESGTELFAGLAFKHKKVSGQLTQGMREFKGRGLFNLAAAEGEGNNPGSLFGREVTLDDLNRLEKNKSETPITRFHASASTNGSTSWPPLFTPTRTRIFR